MFTAIAIEARKISSNRTKQQNKQANRLRPFDCDDTLTTGTHHEVDTICCADIDDDDVSRDDPGKQSR